MQLTVLRPTVLSGSARLKHWAIFLLRPPGRRPASTVMAWTEESVCMWKRENRSWCSSSNENDQRAVTIECAKAIPPILMHLGTLSITSSSSFAWIFANATAKKKLLWLGDKTKALNYNPAADEMVLTVHRWFANKSCPGDWMYSPMGDFGFQGHCKIGREVRPAIPELPAVTFYTASRQERSVTKANADAMLSKVNAAGFDTYMVKSRQSL